MSNEYALKPNERGVCTWKCEDGFEMAERTLDVMEFEEPDQRKDFKFDMAIAATAPPSNFMIQGPNNVKATAGEYELVVGYKVGAKTRKLNNENQAPKWVFAAHKHAITTNVDVNDIDLGIEPGKGIAYVWENPHAKDKKNKKQKKGKKKKQKEDRSSSSSSCSSSSSSSSSDSD